ncbi:MAG: hypothetical protein IRY92_11525 [Dactylosporangium sp.]|nr:hypothetical protein [Dactylosporangium sp.]
MSCGILVFKIPEPDIPPGDITATATGDEQERFAHCFGRWGGRDSNP